MTSLFVSFVPSQTHEPRRTLFSTVASLPNVQLSLKASLRKICPDHLPIRQVFTACNVSRLGLASGFAVVIHANLRLMSSLSIFVLTLGVSLSVCTSSFSSRRFKEFGRLPSSSKNRHKATNAVPIARSMPVGHVKRILRGFVASSLVLDSRMGWRNGARRWRWVRRAREPILPCGIEIWRTFGCLSVLMAWFLACRSVKGSVQLQQTTASQASESIEPLEPIQMDDAGVMSVAAVC